MFDDKNLPSSGQIPPNLPMNEPDDMLAPTEDSGAPSALDAGILRPKAGPAPVATPSAPPASNPGSMTSTNSSTAARPDGNFTGLPPEFEAQTTAPESSPSSGRGILTTVIILVVLLIVGGGGLWVYMNFVRGGGDAKPVPQVTPQPQPQPAPAPTPAPAPAPTPAPEAVPLSSTTLDTQILDGRPLDTDNDGIPDEEEKRTGTDSLNWDTDSDGLSDGDEIYTWKTNALKADSDADGYKDGEEIRNGYNPKGPGKLFDPNTTSTTKATTSINVSVGATTSVK